MSLIGKILIKSMDVSPDDWRVGQNEAHHKPSGNTWRYAGGPFVFNAEHLSIGPNFIERFRLHRRAVKMHEKKVVQRFLTAKLLPTKDKTEQEYLEEMKAKANAPFTTAGQMVASVTMNPPIALHPGDVVEMTVEMKQT